MLQHITYPCTEEIVTELLRRVVDPRLGGDVLGLSLFKHVSSVLDRVVDNGHSEDVLVCLLTLANRACGYACLLIIFLLVVPVPFLFDLICSNLYNEEMWCVRSADSIVPVGSAPVWGAQVHAAALRCLLRLLPSLPARPVTQLRGIAAAAAQFFSLHDGTGEAAALVVGLRALARGCPAAAQEVVTVYGDDAGFARVNEVMQAELIIMAEVSALLSRILSWQYYYISIWRCQFVAYIVQEAAAEAALAAQASAVVISEPPVVPDARVAPAKTVVSPLSTMRPLWRP